MLAIVEDPNPPAYEPVALSENAADGGSAAAIPIDGKPVTSSLRATRRLLASVAGWRSYFRGYVCAAVMILIEKSLSEILGGFVPGIPVGQLLARLALVQLSTAWTHIVISGPTKRRFYQRLPPFRKTFEATSLPVLAAWAAYTVVEVITSLAALAIGLTPVRDHADIDVPFLVRVAWKSLFVFFLNIALRFLLLVPIEVVLVRIQASLLPPDEDAIIPFDRSFQGKVQPAVVDGKGYVGMRDAFETVPATSWVRLYKLYGKITAINIAVLGLFMAVLIPEAFLLASASD